ncbi:MAG: ethylbenzene dehydrogenase-related protein [Gammaproteobacteria bacterium]
MNRILIAAALGLTLALAQAPGIAAASSPEWDEIEPTELMLFYPGIAAVEWVLGDIRIDKERHQGSRGLKVGDRCIECHLADPEELVFIGEAIAAGKWMEPAPIEGKPGTIPVTVRAAHDDEELYLQFSWTQPPASGTAPMDTDNPVKISFMLDAGKVAFADQAGCWASCHADSRGMPEGDEDRSKYVTGGSLADGVFYDLLQWRSGEDKAYDGHVADERVMTGGTALEWASGKLEGDTWTVVFKRRFEGGEGDVTLRKGAVYNIGVAIHDDHAAGRYHHVSMGYTLGIDAKADIVARHH